MDYKLLGTRVRHQRQLLGWTQEQLAEAVGVSTSFVGHIERGSRKASIDTLVEMANAMSVTADYLLAGNLDAVNRRMIPQNLKPNQKLVMQEILTTLQQQLDKWNVEEAEQTSDMD